MTKGIEYPLPVISNMCSQSGNLVVWLVLLILRAISHVIWSVASRQEEGLWSAVTLSGHNRITSSRTLFSRCFSAFNHVLFCFWYVGKFETHNITTKTVWHFRFTGDKQRINRSIWPVFIFIIIIMLLRKVTQSPAICSSVLRLQPAFTGWDWFLMQI